jgi:hypothetical protein
MADEWAQFRPASEQNDWSQFRTAAQQQAKEQPEDVTAGMGLRGVPLLGAYVPQAEAAIRAAAQPITGVGAPGATWRERYEANLPLQEAQYAQAERESPVTSAALQMAGGTAALAPVGATALGARALGMTGGLLSRTAMGGASGAALSAADAYLRGEDPTTAAYLGGGIGAAAAPIASAVGRVISPFQRSANRAAAVNYLASEGVTDLTAGQKSGSEMLKWAESHMGGISGGSAPILESQQKQFTRAAATKGGINADELNPAVINDAFDNWGQKANQLAGRTALYGTDNIQDLGTYLTQRVQDYGLAMQGAPGKAPEHFLGRIIDALDQNGGIIPGKIFQGITSDMFRIAKGSDWQTKLALNDMRGAMFDAMERGAAGTPDEKMWRQLNRQYRNLLTLEKAVGNPTETTALEGTISPSQLYRAIGARSYARGRSDLEPLARSGLALMKPMPSSGTAQRLAITGAVGGALGGLYDLSQGRMPSSGSLYGSLAAFPAGRALMSPLAQRYLANQMLMRTPQLPAYAAPVAGAFMQQ